MKIHLLIVAGLLYTSCHGQTNQPAYKDFRYAARVATPAVVHIKSIFTAKMDKETREYLLHIFGNDLFKRFFSPLESSGEVQMGSASGVIISKDGFIVTDYHVVDSARSIEVILADKRTYKARVVGSDRTTDLALLKIDARELAYLQLGNSDSVEVGEPVLAVGNPFNLAFTVTSGIVGAKSRSINVIDDSDAVESYIQTDAVVNPGSSGGALVDMNGSLIGITAAISSPTGVYAGYSFAIPADIVKKVVDDLLTRGRVEHAYLGVTISDLDGDRARELAIRLIPGVYIDSVGKDGAAFLAGVQQKDIVTKIDNYDVDSTPRFSELLACHRPGDRIGLTLVRGGQEKLVYVTLQSSRDGNH